MLVVSCSLFDKKLSLNGYVISLISITLIRFFTFNFCYSFVIPNEEICVEVLNSLFEFCSKRIWNSLIVIRTFEFEPSNLEPLNR
jgi:hypothetical protein